MRTKTTTRSASNRSNIVGLHQPAQQLSSVVATTAGVVSCCLEQHDLWVVHHDEKQHVLSLLSPADDVFLTILVLVAFPETFTTL
jgi:hypothetical protein